MRSVRSGCKGAVAVVAALSLLERGSGGAALVTFDFPNVTYANMNARQIAMLEGAYATDLASPRCVGTDAASVTNEDGLPNMVTIVPCPNSQVGLVQPVAQLEPLDLPMEGGDHPCITGTRIKALILTSASDAVQEYGTAIRKESCLGGYGAVFNTTLRELGTLIELVLPSQADLQMCDIVNIRITAHATPMDIAEEEQEEQSYWWIGLIIVLVVCCCGVIVAASFRPKNKKEADDEEPAWAEERAGFDQEPLIVAPPDDEQRTVQEELPFPDVGFAERGHLRKPQIAVPYPEVGYGMAIASGNGNNQDGPYRLQPMDQQTQKMWQETGAAQYQIKQSTLTGSVNNSMMSSNPGSRRGPP